MLLACQQNAYQNCDIKKQTDNLKMCYNLNILGTTVRNKFDSGGN
jgi:hypothetical protein